MKVFIAGVGEVGYHVVAALYREGVEITVTDTDPVVLEKVRQEFHCNTLQGNATDTSFLDSAGIRQADLFLAVTNHDETNIIACMLAAEAGVAKKIARVKSIAFSGETSVYQQSHLGIDLVINPYEVAAEHLINLVRHPQVTDYTSFFSGKVLLVRFPIGADSPLVDKTVYGFGQLSGLDNVLIALIQRKGQSTIPQADDRIEAGDHIYFFCEAGKLHPLTAFLGQARRPARRVIINGGGNVGLALARRLEGKVADVRILDRSEERCNRLSLLLDKTLVLHGNGIDSALLKAEGIEGVDTYLSLTNQDQVNIVSAMLAKKMGAQRTISLIKQPELLPMIRENPSIHAAFCPRLLTARKLLHFVRGLELQSFFSFANSDVEVLELEVQSGMPCLQGRLMSFNLPSGLLIGAVERRNQLFVPRGGDQLQEGDRILVLQQRKNRAASNAFFLGGKRP